MSRNLFLSFLGTGNYKECNYYFNDKKVDNVKFVQVAMTKIFCEEWDENDVIYILCTNEASDRHWNSLRESLKDIRARVEKVCIPDIKSTEDIWEIFRQIISLVNENNRVIFDITHGFRSLPMIALSIMNYLESIKNVSIEGIYYGAFEVLGSVNDVEKIPIEKRDAPILDLTLLKIIQDWAKAADIFEKTGKITDVKKLTTDRCKSLLKASKGKDVCADSLKRLIERIDNIQNSIEASRSKDLLNGDFNGLKQDISKLKKQQIIEPLNLVLDKIEKNFEDFNDDFFKNTFAVVDWCIKYGMLQQGYTYLRECIDSYFVSIQFGDQSVWDTSLRGKVSEYVYQKYVHKKMMNLNENMEKIDGFFEKIGENFIGKLNNLSAFRNDINHCGFNKKPESVTVLSGKLMLLKNYFENLLLG